MNFDNDVVQYEFQYRSTDDDLPGFPKYKNIQVRVDFDPQDTWMAVLKEFCHFLEGIYGYSISDQVQVKGQDISEFVMNEALGVEQLNRKMDEAANQYKSEKKRKKEQKKEKNYIMGSVDNWQDE